MKHGMHQIHFDTITVPMPGWHDVAIASLDPIGGARTFRDAVVPPALRDVGTVQRARWRSEPCEHKGQFTNRIRADLAAEGVTGHTVFVYEASGHWERNVQGDH